MKPGNDSLNDEDTEKKIHCKSHSLHANNSRYI